MQGNDVGPVQTRLRLCLDAESLQELLVAEQVRREHLQRYGPVERGVMGFVYDTHSSLAELADNEIVGERAPDLDGIEERLAWPAVPGFLSKDRSLGETVSILWCCGTASATYEAQIRHSRGPL